jgi:hypothetical protein
MFTKAKQQLQDGGASECTTLEQRSVVRFVGKRYGINHHYQLETKCASMQWKHPASPAKKKFKVTPSSRKVMLTVFCDHEDILLTVFLPQGQTVNTDSYCNILRKLRKAIQQERPGLVIKGMLLFHDEYPHTAKQDK